MEFSYLRKKNVERLGCYKKCLNWSFNDWMVATMGELGEAANVLKKVARGDYDLDAPLKDKEATTIRQWIGHELADVVIYLDLLALNLGIDLEAAVIEKFNIVSDRIGTKVKL